MIARRLRIRGEVQGVFYRQWAIAEATALGLVGWICNRADGSVEALAIGEQGAVERFVTACHAGSPDARVETVEVEEAEMVAPEGFRQRSTH